MSGYVSRLKNCWTEGDPKLRGSGKFAFRPTSGSPCIDAGNNAYVTNTVDFAGNARIVNNKVHIGAYEELSLIPI